MDDNDWVSAHIFYRGDLDRVLIHLVDPLVGELAGAKLVTASFFLRYWDGGPHIRLRLLPGPAGPEPVRRRVDQRCGELFRTHPAPDLDDPADYPAWAGELARLEGVGDYQRHPYPNNSLAYLPYRREHHRYGHGEAIEAVERHFVESSQIALALIKAGLPAGERDTAALSLLLLAWLSVPRRLDRRPADRQPPEVLPAMAERFERQRDTLRQIAERMRTISLQPAGSSQGALAAWNLSLGRLRAALAVAGTGENDVSRIIDLCAHLACNRLGLTPLDEQHLRYLATRTMATATPDGPLRTSP